MMSNTKTPFPSETGNKTHGFWGTYASNKPHSPLLILSTEQAWVEAMVDLSRHFGWTGSETRRILDSVTGRHLADQMTSGEEALSVMKRWMRGRNFREQIEDLRNMTDQEFYG